MDLAALERQYAPWRSRAEVPPDTVLFYSSRRGDPAFRALSNFGDSPLIVVHPVVAALGLAVYPSAEHYFNAMKDVVDLANHEWVRTAPSPMDAKRRGGPRGVWDPALGAVRRIGLRDGWDARERYHVMLDAQRLKYTQHADLRELLLSTGDRYLAEDSSRDFHWGVRDARGGFGGHNFLGRCLIRVRAELRLALSL